MREKRNSTQPFIGQYKLTGLRRLLLLLVFQKLSFSIFSPGMSPPRHSSSNETPRSVKGDPTPAKAPNAAPLGAAFPHSYEFHTKRKMFDKGPEVQ